MRYLLCLITPAGRPSHARVFYSLVEANDARRAFQLDGFQAWVEVMP